MEKCSELRQRPEVQASLQSFRFTERTFCQWVLAYAESKSWDQKQRNQHSTRLWKSCHGSPVFFTYRGLVMILGVKQGLNRRLSERHRKDDL
jgi:hypothetical protein